MSYKWKLLEQATLEGASYDDPENQVFVRGVMEARGCSYAEAKAILEQDDARCEYWINDLYQVQTRKFIVPELDNAEMMHINIRRRDGGAIFDWRHRQLIKNQLLGPECEAVELYPAESRLVDTSNKYHLWGFTDPSMRFPFGMLKRDIVEEEVKLPAGARQRRM